MLCTDSKRGDGVWEEISTFSSDLEQPSPLPLRGNEHCLPSAQYGDHCHQPMYRWKSVREIGGFPSQHCVLLGTSGGVPFPRNQHRMTRGLETPFWADELRVRPAGIMSPWREVSIASQLESHHQPSSEERLWMAEPSCVLPGHFQQVCMTNGCYRIRRTLHKSLLSFVCFVFE